MEVLIFIAGQIIGGCIGFFTCALCVAVGDNDRKDDEQYVEPEDNNRDCKDDPER